MMQALNLPEYPCRLRTVRSRPEIFDPVRKKFVRLTPEEWVRQHFINFLVSHRQFPASLIHVEASLKYNTLDRRSDIVVYSRAGRAVLAVECKAPAVAINEKVLSQMAVYNASLKVPCLVLTNGLEHYILLMGSKAGTYSFAAELPAYAELEALSGGKAAL